MHLEPTMVEGTDERLPGRQQWHAMTLAAREDCRTAGNRPVVCQPPSHLVASEELAGGHANKLQCKRAKVLSNTESPRQQHSNQGRGIEGASQEMGRKREAGFSDGGTFSGGCKEAAMGTRHSPPALPSPLS